MVTLSQLCEPNRRGNRINWDVEDNETEKYEEPLPVKEEPLECPTDVCIFYFAALMRVWKDASVVLSCMCLYLSGLNMSSQGESVEEVQVESCDRWRR
jgi:hypothetical protein